MKPKKKNGFWFGFRFFKPKPENRFFQFLKPKTKPKKLKKTGFFGFKNRFLNLNNVFKRMCF